MGLRLHGSMGYAAPWGTRLHGSIMETARAAAERAKPSKAARIEALRSIQRAPGSSLLKDNLAARILQIETEPDE